MIQNVGSLTLDALAANTSGASFTPEVTRGSARVRNLGWGTFFGRRSDGDGVTRDVNTRGIMVGAELGETIGIFFGAANSTFGADSEANHRFAGVYANLAAGGFDIDTSLTFGQTDASSDGLVIADNRLMPGFSTTDVSAESTYVTPAITVAREFDVGSGTVTPSFRLSYTLIETETSSLSIGPLTLAEGAGREDHLYNARFQVERGLQEIILEDGLLSAKLRGGFDTSYMDASGSGRDWDSTRAFVGAEFTYSSEDGAVELSGGIELGRTSNEVTDARANLGFAVRF